MREETPDLAFDQVVDDHYLGLYRFALSLSRSVEQASDLTQQCFLIYARKGNQLRDRSKVKSWLFTTLYREYLAQRRRQARLRPVDSADIVETLPAMERGPDRKLDGELVLEALQGLDPMFREPLTLFYVRDFSYKEIAAILEIPIGTVMSRLSRGKAELKRRLGFD